MGFNHIGDLKLEGLQTIRIPFFFGNHVDVGAQYFAANPIATFPSNNVSSNVGWVIMSDQQKAKVFPQGTTFYFVTVRNPQSSGVECDFDGGGF